MPVSPEVSGFVPAGRAVNSTSSSEAGSHPNGCRPEAYVLVLWSVNDATPSPLDVTNHFERYGRRALFLFKCLRSDFHEQRP